MRHNINEGISKSELLRLIDEWIIGRNSERNKDILAERFVHGYTYEELAERFDLSDIQIKNIVHKGVEIINSHADL